MLPPASALHWWRPEKAKGAIASKPNWGFSGLKADDRARTGDVQLGKLVIDLPLITVLQ